MNHPPPVNWVAVLADLRGCGLTLKAIAFELGVAVAMPMRWGEGSQSPNYTNGERLVALWARRTGRPAADVPRGH